MRASTLLNRVLGRPDVRVIDVDPGTDDAAGPLLVQVALKARKRLDCPRCDFSTMAAYDTRWAESSWRHMDVSGRLVVLTMLRRRLACPVHGVVVQGVPFARPGSRFTTDFEDMIAWLATRADKTTVSVFARIAWRTVGAICERVVAEQLDETRFEGLVNIGVDEISWRKHHRYLTLVSDHATSKIVWGAPGKNAAALDAFFKEIGPAKTAAIEAVSMDMGPAFAKSVRANAPDAVICFDPFHVIQVAINALEAFRRSIWQRTRELPDQDITRKFKGTRWVLLKNPQDLTEKQQATLAGLERTGGLLWLNQADSPARQLRIHDHPMFLAAARRHRRLIRQHGRATVHTAFIEASHLVGHYALGFQHEPRMISIWKNLAARVDPAQRPASWTLSCYPWAVAMTAILTAMPRGQAWLKAPTHLRDTIRARIAQEITGGYTHRSTGRLYEPCRKRPMCRPGRYLVNTPPTKDSRSTPPPASDRLGRRPGHNGTAPPFASC